MNRRSRLINEIADRVASALLRESYHRSYDVYSTDGIRDFLFDLTIMLKNIRKLLENGKTGMHDTTLVVKQAQETVEYIEHYFGNYFRNHSRGSNAPSLNSYRVFHGSTNIINKLIGLSWEATEDDLDHAIIPMVEEVHKLLKNLILNPSRFQY